LDRDPIEKTTVIPVGLVVIGRNEGQRLKDCLRSLEGQGTPLVYVDSGSTDGSRDTARSLGADVVELDMSRPFSMARARNAGFQRILELDPDTKYVHFFDGDCSVVPGWVQKARDYALQNPGVAAVCGRRREKFPDSSIYNAMADREWDGPAGPTSSVGGDALFLAEALSSVGGFNRELIAGEEPELCFRLARKGWKVHRIADDMTLHDAGISRFSQWWKRMVRGGYGSLDVYRRCKALGGERDVPFRSMVQSARLWTLGWGAALLVLAFVLSWAWGLKGAFWALLPAALIVAVQSVRIALRDRSSRPMTSRLAFGVLTMVGKWAQVCGHLKYFLDRLSGRKAMLIEYKEPEEAHPSAWKADRARYPRRAFLREQSLWAIAVYRFGRWNDRRRPGPSRWLLDRLYWLLFRIVETLTSVSFTKEVEIGPGLRIHHFGNIFVHSKVRIGAGCTLRQGVTIGNREEGGPVPVIHDNVEMGSYAQVLGGIIIGKGARIGAMSVVLRDVPPGHTAVGIPARIIPPGVRNEKPVKT
jgi:serine acetyltransferase/GT2 family glycosyltransferase